MGYYAIGIGGTGAKVLESMVHLAAAGMMPGDVEFIFVDPDTSNGSRDRVENTVTHYKNCKTNLNLGDTNLLKTGIRGSEHWTPFGANPTLAGYFHSNNFQPAAAHLFEVLYSKTERETTLDKGFHAHPSIGAAVMAQAVNLRNGQPWYTFRETLEQDPDARIFLAGSIFGGTGASGFPTIARCIKDAVERPVKVGGALILPYFQFIFPENGDMQRPEDGDKQSAALRAESKHFLMNTQAALKYYHLRDQTDIYDAVYILGSRHQVLVEPSSGGRNQKNAPHFIELYAALAAIDFFLKNDNDFDNNKYHLTARADENHLRWADLPYVANDNMIHSQIGQLARFAFAYLHVYQPTLQKILDLDIERNQVTWFNKFFKFSGDPKPLLGNRNKIVLDHRDTTGKIDAVGIYCKDFLLWLANIQANCGDRETVHLIKHNAFAKDGPEDGPLIVLKPVDEFEKAGFENFIKGPRAKNLNALWNAMCSGKSKKRDAEGFGEFLSALYHNCG